MLMCPLTTEKTSSLKILNLRYSRKRLAKTQQFVQGPLPLSQHRTWLNELKHRPLVNGWLTRPAEIPIYLKEVKVAYESSSSISLSFLRDDKDLFSPGLSKEFLEEKKRFGGHISIKTIVPREHHSQFVVCFLKLHHLGPIKLLTVVICHGLSNWSPEESLSRAGRWSRPPEGSRSARVPSLSSHTTADFSSW